MQQWHARVNWVINIIQEGNNICLFPSKCYLFCVYRSSSEGAYVVPYINHEWIASHDGLNDFNWAHDPNLISKFSLVGVLVFWFPWYYLSSLNELCSTIGFDSQCCWAKSYFRPIKMSLPAPPRPDVKSGYKTSKLPLNLRCITSHLFQCFVRVMSVQSCEYDVPSSSGESRGGPDGSRIKSFLVASIHRWVMYLLFRMIIQTWELEGR